MMWFDSMGRKPMPRGRQHPYATILYPKKFDGQ